MQLDTTISGPDTPADPLPILLVHGLFGQARNLGVIARRLSQDRKVISADMRNHGNSPHDPDHSYDALAGDLAEVIAAHGGRADVVGHSMGGKASMHLALSHPELVRKLVVLDIAPVAYRHDQTAMIDAMEAVDLTGIASRQQADTALAQGVEEPGTRAFLLQSLDLHADPPRWKLNLPALRDQMGNLTGWPGHEGRCFDGPVLALAGGDSDYVLPEYEDAIRSAFPSARIERIAGAGHWLHAEKPAEVAEAVADFIG
ncbi:alpha/beta fold hydrolase [Paracoccus sp. Z118]|uniref:alpha/beta fold hydrolase n=1 Tax=Paracoccus sp. Z118 TaxID=2851017 RepID=UPI001C2BE7BC|nr:alpha/beta fold hydrolase [Paracoccus sp. Z118]MBV0893319.1 alpha/beta fold hydrolase [Paracoccus sp. Z118]